MGQSVGLTSLDPKRIDSIAMPAFREPPFHMFIRF